MNFTESEQHLIEFATEVKEYMMGYYKVSASPKCYHLYTTLNSAIPSETNIPDLFYCRILVALADIRNYIKINDSENGLIPRIKLILNSYYS